MPNTIPPTVIQGPAYITRNAYAYYTEGDVVIHYHHETWEPKTALFGDLGERLKSKHITVSFTPAGMYTAATAAKYWPYVGTDVGKSILSVNNIVVVPQVGNQVTINGKTGISKLPQATLHSGKTLWGAMEFIAVGDVTLVQDNAAARQTIAATAYTDITFDETKIISPRYNVAYGIAPYDVMEPDEAGVVVTPEVKLNMNLKSANHGLIDVALDSLGAAAKFKPINLTEAQIATLINLQGVGISTLPGDSIGTATSLVITGTGISLTLLQMGAKDASLVYGTGKFRQGEIAFVNKLKVTIGVPQTPWVLA